MARLKGSKHLDTQLSPGKQPGLATPASDGLAGNLKVLVLIYRGAGSGGCVHRREGAQLEKNSGTGSSWGSA